MTEGETITPSESNAGFIIESGVGLSPDNTEEYPADIKELRKEYKRWLIRKSSLDHDGLKYLEEIENVNKMSLEEVIAALKESGEGKGNRRNIAM